MNNQEVFNTIKSTVHSFLPDARILLFGSRAKNSYDKNSDFDLLIITQKTLTPREKINWCGTIDKALVKSLKAPVDILLNSEEEVNIKKNFPGHIIKQAIKEGISL